MKIADVGWVDPMLDSNRMTEFLNRCLKLPFKSGTEHELQVMDLLDEMGIHYTYQPNGSQQYPDFSLPTRWGEIALECKSNQGYSPTYNSGRPHAGGLYVFVSKKAQDCTIFWGDDVLGETKRELYDIMLLELKDVVLRHRSKPEWQDDRGFDFYLREMYTQSGTAEYTNYFTHKDRKQCEQNVFDFFK